MMTGPQGGSWIPLGGQLKDMWEKAIPGLAVQVMPGAGIANARGVDEGKADVGFGNSISTVDGVARQAAVHQAGDQYLQPRHALSAILSVRRQRRLRRQQDRRTSRASAITTQQRGNTGELITRQILEVNGLNYNDVKVELRRLFRLGEPDEGRPRRRLRARHANSGRRRDGSRRRARHQADRSVAAASTPCASSIPATRSITIPKGTYPKQDKDVKVIGYATHVVRVVQAAGG